MSKCCCFQRFYWHMSFLPFLWLCVHLPFPTILCKRTIAKGFPTIPDYWETHSFLSFSYHLKKLKHLTMFTHFPRDATRSRRMRWFCLCCCKCGKSLSGKENEWKGKWNVRITCYLTQVICWERKRERGRKRWRETVHIHKLWAFPEVYINPHVVIPLLG